MPDIGSNAIGLRAVLDMAGFNANASTFLTTIASLNSSVLNMAKNAVQGNNQVGQSADNVATKLSRVGSIVMGIVVADVFRGIVNGLQNIAGQAADAVSQFQLLKIQLDTVSAVDFQKTNGGSIADALIATSGQAKDLLYWIRQIAVTTPFSVASLGQAMQMSRAYGFTTEEAKALTVTVGNFTAGMGLADDSMTRIIFALGQMVTLGRPSGRQLRELGTAFVPVNAIVDAFSQKLNKSSAEIQKMFETGAISGIDFVNMFEQVVNPKFEGSMNRMSNTFLTATNNIKDFFQSMIGFEVLGPIADKVAEQINGAIAGLLTMESYQSAANIGQTLLFSFNQIVDVITRAVNPAFTRFFDSLGIGSPSIMGFSSALLSVAANFVVLGNKAAIGASEAAKSMQSMLAASGTSFNDITSKMFGWGENMIFQLASGIASGIIYVIQALTSVAKVITSLLQSHSPPLLLPELDQWGTSAMEVYMEGWKDINFKVFDDIGNEIESAISSWGSKIDTQTMMSMIIGSNVAIAKATEEFRQFGEVTIGTMQEIAGAAGFAFDQMGKFVTLSFDVSKFTEISDAVKNLFDFKGVGRLDLFGNMVSSFTDAKAYLDRFGSELKGQVLSYINDSIAMADVNKLLTDSQKELSDTTAGYDNILSDLNAQLQQVQNQQEDLSRVKVIDKTLNSVILTADERSRLELEKKNIMITRQIKTTTAEKDVALKAINSKITGYEDEKKTLQLKLDAETDYIKTTSDAQLKSAKDQLAAVKSLIDAQIKLNGLLNKGLTAKLAIDTSALDALPADIASALGGASLAGIDFKAELDKLWAKVLTDTATFWATVFEPFKPVEKAWNDMVGQVQAAIETPAMQQAWTTLLGTFTSIKETLTTWWNTGGKTITDSITAFFGTLFTNLFVTNETQGKSVLQIIADGIDTVAKAVAGKSDDIAKIIDKFSEFVNLYVVPAFKDFLKNLAEKWIPALLNFAVWAAPKFIEMLEYIVDNFASLSIIFLALQGLAKIGEIAIGIKVLAGVGGFAGSPWIAALMTSLGIVGGVLGAVALVTLSFLIIMPVAEAIGQAFKDAHSGMSMGDWVDLQLWGMNRHPTLLQVGVEFMGPNNGIDVWLKKTGPDIANWSAQAIIDIGKWTTQAGTDISNWSAQALIDLGKWINKAGPDIANWSAQAIIDIGKWTTQAGTDITNWGAQAGTDIHNFNVNAGKDISEWATTKAGPDVANWSAQALIDIGKFTTQAGTDIANWSAQAIIDTEKWSVQTGTDIANWSAQAITDTEKWSNRAGTDVANWSAQAIIDIEKWSTQTGTDIANWSAQALIDLGKWITKAGPDIANWSAQAIIDIEKWTTQAGIDIGNWVSTALIAGQSFVDSLGTGMLNPDSLFMKAVGWVIDQINNVLTLLNSPIKIPKPVLPTPTPSPNPSENACPNGYFWDGFSCVKSATGGGNKSNSTGGSFRIPNRFINESYPLGLGNTASAGEIVTVTPANVFNDFLQALTRGLYGKSYGRGNMTSGGGTVSTINNDNRTYLEVNPTYESYASPVTIYHDVSAALAGVRS